jgi:hypothetical protein
MNISSLNSGPNVFEREKSPPYLLVFLSHLKRRVLHFIADMHSLHSAYNSFLAPSISSVSSFPSISFNMSSFSCSFGFFSSLLHSISHCTGFPLPYVHICVSFGNEISDKNNNGINAFSSSSTESKISPSLIALGLTITDIGIIGGKWDPAQQLICRSSEIKISSLPPMHLFAYINKPQDLLYPNLHSPCAFHSPFSSSSFYQPCSLASSTSSSLFPFPPFSIVDVSLVPLDTSQVKWGDYAVIPFNPQKYECIHSLYFTVPFMHPAPTYALSCDNMAFVCEM